MWRTVFLCWASPSTTVSDNDVRLLLMVSTHCNSSGPYAFMDVFDPMHICNHSDEEGRYSYKNQPAMMYVYTLGAYASVYSYRSHATTSLFALRALFNAISPLIGHELDHANARPGVGWAANLSDDEIKALGDKGRESLEKELEETFLEECNGEYGKRMREVRRLSPFTVNKHERRY